MDTTLFTTLISVGATLLTNLIIHLSSYYQKKLELQSQRQVKDLEFKNANILNNKSLYLETFQEFCSISGKTVTHVDSRKSHENPTNIEVITEFDEIFYKTYVLLNTTEEKQTFLTFRNTLRTLAGYPDPNGLYIWDVMPPEFEPAVLEEPRYIFEQLGECLDICHKHIINFLND